MFVGILTSCFSESALLYLLTVVFGTATTAAILVLPVIKNTGRKKENGISNTIVKLQRYFWIAVGSLSGSGNVN